MGKLIMWNLMTLDGFFEGTQNWDLDFHRTVWGDELERFAIGQLSSTSRLLFGRVTYEGMAAYWKTAEGTVADYMNRLPKVVFSRTLENPDWNNTIQVRDNAASVVRALKKQAEQDLYVFGSANLCETLIEADLFDEYRIAVAPVMLGSGRPLFKNGLTRHNLRLIDTTTYTSGCVVLRYAND
ncbi:dihydrofolate reductase family protein [Dyella psychrodurans]|uniref:Dihydrofolate reductase n=1 Tax=Dyella psychrodurans TaxID=1927960 RepID=A0A370XBJ4_9GAMM|nr:dihydrofolate reductase family protein [Dyella psychrodurans]RDS85794.1 dihydrofolate reductase [Dyella psychrodurans]